MTDTPMSEINNGIIAQPQEGCRGGGARIIVFGASDHKAKLRNGACMDGLAGPILIEAKQRQVEWSSKEPARINGQTPMKL
jgi:hypothetical protein